MRPVTIEDGRVVTHGAPELTCRTCGRPMGEEEFNKLTELGVRRIEVTSGRLDMELTVSQEVMRTIAGSAAETLGDAPNYVEMQFREQTRPGWLTLTIQRHDGKTPHQMRQEVESRLATVEAERAADQAIATAGRAFFDAFVQTNGQAFPWMPHDLLTALVEDYERRHPAPTPGDTP